MSDLEARIGHSFREVALLEQALTHRSFRHEDRRGIERDNERLEFLGDAILGLLVSVLLFHRFPDRPEGELSRLRSHLVSARRLAVQAQSLGLGGDLRLGRGEELSGGRDKESILADAYESVIAAVFLDGGMEAARAFVERELGPELEVLGGAHTPHDYKSSLQEALHARGQSEPAYQVVEEAGPEHSKVFEVAVAIAGSTVGRGIGKTKKAAQQAAARAALEALGL